MPSSPELDQKIRIRFDELIEEGSDLTGSGSSAEREAFLIKAISLTSAVFGESERGRKVEKRISHTFEAYRESHALTRITGILQGMKNDYENGFLDDLEKRVVADVSADYMTQVEALLDENQSGPNGYIPAAMLCGAVLEDSLRRLCARQTPRVSIEKPNGKHKLLNALIQDLQKANAYNKLKANQLRTWASVRNSADHGNFSEFDRKQVEEMVRGVTDFLADYL